MSIHLTPHGLSRPHWYALVAVLAFSFLLIPQKSEAGIYARIPPPADIHETPGPPPHGRNYVWVSGHWRWQSRVTDLNLILLQTILTFWRRLPTIDQNATNNAGLVL